MLIMASGKEIKQLSMWNHHLLRLQRSQGQKARHWIHSLPGHMHKAWEEASACCFFCDFNFLKNKEKSFHLHLNLSTKRGLGCTALFSTKYSKLSGDCLKQVSVCWHVLMSLTSPGRPINIFLLLYNEVHTWHFFLFKLQRIKLCGGKSQSSINACLGIALLQGILFIIY